ISMDVPPFCVSGARNTLHSINLVGLRRNGVSREHITLVRRAFWEVFRAPLPRKEMTEVLRTLGKDCPLVDEMAEFVATAKRPIAKGARGLTENDDESVE